MGDLLGVHDLFHHALGRGFAVGGLRLSDALFQFRDAAVFQLRRLAEIAAPFGVGEFRAQPVQLLLGLRGGGQLVLFRAPGSGQLVRAFLEVSNLLRDLLQPVL